MTAVCAAKTRERDADARPSLVLFVLYYAWGLAVPQLGQKLPSFVWPQPGQIHSADSSGRGVPHSSHPPRYL